MAIIKYSVENKMVVLSLLMVFLMALKGNEVVAQKQQARVLFWNIENLFDPADDSLTVDEEFTPEGMRYWTKSRFYEKVNKSGKVIIATGNPYPPDIIGLCEIECENVVKKLLYSSPLAAFKYRYVHYESPDRRGVDVALLYNPSVMTPLYSEPVTIHFPDNPASTTRDILYVKGLLWESDTIHFFVNHWPSRYGGYMQTVPKRNYVASVLKRKCDSIVASVPDAAIVIMGDFNDNPTDESVFEILNAKEQPSKMGSSLVNLMLPHAEKGAGTLKHVAVWSVFDMLIVSSSLLQETFPLGIKDNQAVIFKRDFLLEQDEKNLGMRLNRTFIGMKFHGGYSDHLPIYLDLYQR